MAQLSGDWLLHYTTHLGFSPPDKRPQFLATLGGADPALHIRHAAGLGMAGVLYPWAMERPARELDAARRALEETGLRSSCLVVLSADGTGPPVWTDHTPAGRARLEASVAQAARLGQALRATTLVALVETDPDRAGPGEGARQRADAAANLHAMAGLAADHGVGLGIEPMLVRPHSMARTTAQGRDLVLAADHPGVGLVYDTAHVAMMDGELLPPLVDAFEQVSVIQLADAPGRVEPGAGELDLVGVGVEMVRRGYDGLVDLEHHWLEPTVDGEAAGLARLRAFDDAVRRAATAPV